MCSEDRGMPQQPVAPGSLPMRALLATDFDEASVFLRFGHSADCTVRRAMCCTGSERFLYSVSVTGRAQ